MKKYLLFSISMVTAAICFISSCSPIDSQSGEVTLQGHCLFVSTASDTGDPLDVPLINKLRSWGCVVTVVEDATLNALVDSFSLYDFAFLSESPNSSNLSPFRGHPLPLVNLESWACSKANVLNWSSYPGAVSNYDSLMLFVVEGAPTQLTGGLSSGAEFKFVNGTSAPGEAEIGFIPTIDRIPLVMFKCDTLVSDFVAFQGIDSSAIDYTAGLLTAACAVEKGTVLADGVSTTLNRAVTIGIHANAYQFLTEEAYAMIKASIQWVLE